MLPESILASLNPPQRKAVETLSGPLLVLAGAGTGKTRVLTTRIANIIASNLAWPNNILAVTFTNKAAKEMNERVAKLTNGQGINIGTFHSIAAKILRSHAGLYDPRLTANFTIIDQDDQIKLIKNIAAASNIDIKAYPPKLTQHIISRWKDLGILPHQVSDSDLKLPVDRIAKNIYSEYQKQLLDSNAVDFGDLLLYNNQLFINNPELLTYYQDRFKYILVDEYQDTNAVQYVWTRMLASKHKNLCCVGDDDQSIYGWRGAELGNILRFEKDFPEATIIKLEQNYRSTTQILSAASALISQNKHRHGKTLWTDQKTGNKIKIIACWNDKEEARFIVSEIERLLHSKTNADQIAILVRAGFQTRVFEEVFNSNAVPYRMVGGLRFYERMEIRDLVAYIRVILNHSDNLAFERIINVPKRSIGNTTLKQIKDFAASKNSSVFNAIKEMLSLGLLKSKSKEALEKLVKQVEHWAIQYNSKSAFEVTKKVLEESGYLDMWKQEKTEEARGRIDNINELLRAIDEFDDISEFMQHASLIMENDSLESNFGGAVNVMTLHAAKGLEFDTVFLPGLEEGIFPYQKALQEEGAKGLEEERRIAYVGITRAKNDLYISYAENRLMFGDKISSMPSRFIAEIPKELCYFLSPRSNVNYLGSRHSFSFHPNPPAHKPPLEAMSAPKGLNPGSKVKHKLFGAGIIIRKRDDSLEVMFDKEGLKTIKENYVELC
jgi:DNA helicase-2/ATP-dependent DNA helicase PcrA